LAFLFQIWSPEFSSQQFGYYDFGIPEREHSGQLLRLLKMVIHLLDPNKESPSFKKSSTFEG
jgi:hypothetical protein